MTRSLRITYPGAIYHIINRGCRKDNIFRCIADREEFLEKLLSSSQKYGIIVHAYCLMDNHFHLLIETPNENLSVFMQMLQCGYANWFKAKYELVGPLFQSRFKSVLVENESYLITLSAYIHLNPFRANIVDHPLNYRWSSCRFYLRNEKSELVDPSVVLEYAGGAENYRFILNEMTKDKPLPEMIYGKHGILGTESFKEKIAKQISKAEKDEKAVAKYRQLSIITPEKIAETVKKIMKVTDEQLTAKTKANTARKLYLYMLKKHTDLSLTEIAEIAGMHFRSAGELTRRFAKEINKEKVLLELVSSIEKNLYMM